jgi:hypothetical protein
MNATAISPRVTTALGGQTTEQLADQAISQIRALRALEVSTGCITRRTQFQILKALEPAVLTIVALELK